MRELGRERFADGRNLFLTERREVLDLREWEERDRDREDEDEGPLTGEERELRSLRRAEDEEVYYAGGTKGRGVMGNAGASDGDGVRTLGFKAKMDDAARTALAEMGKALQSEGGGGGGTVIQLVRQATAFAIDVIRVLIVLTS